MAKAKKFYTIQKDGRFLVGSDKPRFRRESEMTLDEDPLIFLTRDAAEKAYKKVKNRLGWSYDGRKSQYIRIVSYT